MAISGRYQMSQRTQKRSITPRLMCVVCLLAATVGVSAPAYASNPTDGYASGGCFVGAERRDGSLVLASDPQFDWCEWDSAGRARPRPCRTWADFQGSKSVEIRK